VCALLLLHPGLLAIFVSSLTHSNNPDNDGSGSDFFFPTLTLLSRDIHLSFISDV
jgi:hypothetical protein